MIDQDMNLGQVRKRRLQIALELALLAERDCEQRKLMLGIESESTALYRELAELDLLEWQIAPRGEK